MPDCWDDNEPGAHRETVGVMKIMFTVLEEAHVANWGPGETKVGDCRGQGKQKGESGSFSGLLPAAPSLPSPHPLPATDTEHPANLSSTHVDGRANGSLSNLQP